MEYRSPSVARWPALAAELLDLNVDVILSTLTPPTEAAMKATRTIPIVFMLVADPVDSGFVATLARPGGNVTGVSNAFFELSRKAVELLTEAVPGTSRVVYLWHCGPSPPRICHRILEEIRAGARAVRAALEAVQETKDFEGAFAAVTRMRPDALIVLANQFTYDHQARIVDFALRQRLPLMAHGEPGWPEAGALMTYLPNYDAQGRRAAHLVNKILKGANPAELPVELPTTFKLIINLKTQGSRPHDPPVATAAGGSGSRVTASAAFHQLEEFLTSKMRMSHIYQPVLLRVLLDNGGRALRQIAGRVPR
jgi:putative ABC transport system substrate-binding protein